MRLQWKGRSYRPAGNYIRVYKPDINELMKPLSMKKGLGSAMLTGEVISGIGDAYGPQPTSPVITPSSTPSVTQTSTPTPSITQTNTPSITPSVTSSPVPADCLWNLTDEFWSGNTNNWEVCQDVPVSPTPSVTQTQTPSVTPTLTTTNTPSLTPSSTPPFTPSGITNLQYWFMSDSGATSSSWTNYGLLGGSATQSVVGNQPQIVTGATLGTGYTGQAIEFGTSPKFYSGNTSGINIQAHTSYLVYKPFTSSADGWGPLLYSATTLNWMYNNWSIDTSATTRMNRGEYRTRRIDNNSNGTPYLITSSGSTSGVIASSNDVLGVTGSSAFTGFQTNNFRIGSTSGSNVQKIQMFEWLYFNRQLTLSEHNSVLTYLKNKYRYNTW